MIKKGNVKKRKQKFILALLIYLIAVLVVTTKTHADDLLGEIDSLIAFIDRQNTLPTVRHQNKKINYKIHINKAADRYRLDPYLIEAIIKVESGFNPRAVSHKGAMGLMQIMPETAKEIGVTRPYDPSENIMGGTYYYKLMLRRFGNKHKKALYAYNCGPECVEKGNIPKESRQYAYNVLRVYKNLKRKEKEGQ